MYRIVLLCLLCIVGCKSQPPASGVVNVAAPGVRVNVQDDGGVMVKHPAGTVVVP